MSNVILRLPAVKARTGLSRSSIYLRSSEGSFPSPISLGGRAVGWIESEVEAWIAGRIHESRSTDFGVAGGEPETRQAMRVQL